MEQYLQSLRGNLIGARKEQRLAQARFDAATSRDRELVTLRITTNSRYVNAVIAYATAIRDWAASTLDSEPATGQ